jgi:S-adenosyl-L-methionine hydrolase (adenosine-forming)
MRRPIVFVTDYGRDDAYAAALVGAVWRVNPSARCVEGTHGVPPGDVLAGAYHLKSLALAFDRDVVLCAVVDPGVGTARRAIAVELEGIVCVGPDNGLISYLWDEAPPGWRRAVQLMTPEGASATFHGRDVFAPAAAQLASGEAIDACGEPIDDPLILAESFAARDLNQLHGRVAVVDHFGNAITTVRDADLHGSPIARVRWGGGETDHVVSTYEEIDSGLGALIGSAGHLEIAARGRPAAGVHGPSAHEEITVDLP